MKYKENDIKKYPDRIKDFSKWFKDENKVLIKEVIFIVDRDKSHEAGFKHFFQKINKNEINNEALRQVIQYNIEANGLHYTTAKLYNNIFSSRQDLSTKVSDIEGGQEIKKRDLDDFFGE